MKNHHISRRMKNGDFELKNGAPGGTRTHDPLLRRQMHVSSKTSKNAVFRGFLGDF